MFKYILLCTFVIVVIFQNCAPQNYSSPATRAAQLNSACQAGAAAGEVAQLDALGTNYSDEIIRAYLIIYWARRTLSVSSTDIGMDESVINNYAAAIITDEDYAKDVNCSVTKPKVLGTMILQRAKVLAGADLSVSEDVFYSTRYREMLSRLSPALTLSTAIEDVVYYQIVQLSQYRPAAEEESQLKEWIKLELVKETPLKAASIGASWFILNRAVASGYVTSDYYADAKNIVEPLLAAGRTAEEIVGKLIVEVRLTCPTNTLSKVTSYKVRGPGISRRSVGKVITHPRGSTASLSARSVSFEVAAGAEYVVLSDKDITAELKELQHDIEIVSNDSGVFKACLVRNLSSATASELIRRGNRILSNAQVKFLSMTTCPYTKYTNTFMTMAQAKAAIGVTPLKSSGLSGQGIKVAILDSGVETSHPDFGCTSGACNISSGLGSGVSIADNIGHGTHVTSIVTGSNGIANSSEVLMYRINGSYSLIAILNSLANTGVRVANMSFSSTADQETINSLVDEMTISHGIMFVAAAGNCDMAAGNTSCEGQTTQGILSPVDGVKRVGAPGGALRAIAAGVSSPSSAYPPLISLEGPTAIGDYTVSKPDVLAPGQLICAAEATVLEAAYQCSNSWSPEKAGFFGSCDSTHAILSGSSMAAPMVTGSVALVLEKRPEWNPDEVKSALKSTAIKKGGLYSTGAGLIQANAAAAITGYPPTVRLDKVRYLASGSVTITGAVYDRDIAQGKFTNYKIYIGNGRGPASYVLLKTFARQVGSFSESGVLFAIDSIPTCFSGEATFKVEVTDAEGHKSTEYALVYL